VEGSAGGDAFAGAGEMGEASAAGRCAFSGKNSWDGIIDNRHRRNKTLGMVRAKTTASSTTMGFDAELWHPADTRLRNRDISTFRFDPREMSADALKLLGALGRDYVKDLKPNAGKAVRADKGTKAVECLSFRVNQSKPILDEIDTVLAGHYGFTAGELDLEDLWPTK